MYVPGLSDAIQKQLSNFNTNIKLGMKPVRQSRSIFTNTKSKVERKVGHVYKINCEGNSSENCMKSYIGETKRGQINVQKSIRTKEHEYDMKKALELRNNILKEREKQYKKILRTKTRKSDDELNELKTKHATEDDTTTYKTALVEHAVKKGHTFDFENVQNIFRVDDHVTRKSFESMAISMEGYRACNFKSDTQYLNTFTKQIIHSFNFHKRKSKTK